MADYKFHITPAASLFIDDERQIWTVVNIPRSKLPLVESLKPEDQNLLDLWVQAHSLVTSEQGYWYSFEAIRDVGEQEGTFVIRRTFSGHKPEEFRGRRWSPGRIDFLQQIVGALKDAGFLDAHYIYEGTGFWTVVASIGDPVEALRAAEVISGMVRLLPAP